MRKPQFKPRKRSKPDTKKQDEPLMPFDEFVGRVVRVKPHETKIKKG